jgi:hypothetical protein
VYHYEVCMPWGKHKGTRLRDVPPGYLAWVAEEGRSVEPYLRAAVLEELARRFGFASRAAPPPPPPCPSCGRLRDRLSNWYRRAARRCHPDTGGNDVAMALINEARDDLGDLLRQPAG